mmetsp:Transcript_30129/g.76122  ORF Transcript_30129/g.76122 Transcript_30129/m.76122 type:complete len:835 (+) Transcript_30129:139-2643(+)
MTEQATTSVVETLGRLRKSWEAYALSGLGSGAADDEGGAAAAVPQPGLSEVKDWRGIGALTHAQIPACLPIQERLAARAASRAWCRATEHGPAKAAWLKALSEAGLLRIAAAAASEGSGLVASYTRQRYLGGGAGAKVFRGKPMEHGEMKVGGRIRFKQPVASFADGSAAALADCAPPTLQPDVVLTIYDMSSLTVFGSVPISGAKHGKSVQRPLTMTSLQAARISGVGERQACVAAMQKLVVVFSWQLGGSGDDELGNIGVREGNAEEVRWLEGGKDVLRSAAFVGAGCAAPVAVLLEGGRDGPVVEIYCKGGTQSATPYVLREVVSITKAKVPTSVPGVLHGGSVVLWANNGDRAIDFVRLQPPAALAGEEAGMGGTSTGVGAVFARARQAARKGRLRVSAESGAGLDLEASRWGYIVEEVEDDPGQPDIVAGDCIFSIGGQALHSLDEETIHWRFGRNIADGVEVTILPADHMKSILAADKGTSESNGPVVSQAAVHRGDQIKRQHFVFSARIEAWCVASIRDPPRLVAVTDNRLVLADMSDDGAITQEALVGVARAPWKRPVERLVLLDEASDVLLAGVARGVLLWRVPALVAPFGKASGDAELLAAVSMPARCNLVGASLGLSCSSNPLGWVAADCSGAGANTDGGFDVWHFFSGRNRPMIQLAPSRGGAGKKPGLKGDAVSQGFATVGISVDAIAAAMQAAVSAAGGPPGAGTQSTRSWLSKLRQDRMEPLYSAIEKAEPVCADAVRELRRWLRAEGRSAGFARQDGARSLIAWTEELRRLIVWPMQAAFQAEASDSDPEDLPTRESIAANARSTGAAAGTVPRGANQ